jgi:hypothetical protein
VNTSPLTTRLTTSSGRRHSEAKCLTAVSGWSMRKLGGNALGPVPEKRMRVVLLGVLDPDPQAAKATTLTLHLRHRDTPDHGR